MTSERNGPSAEGKSEMVAWCLLWSAGSLLAVWLIFLDYRDIEGIILRSGAAVGRDFANVWTGGNIVLQDQLSLLYSAGGYQDFQRQLFGPIGFHAYSYPPSTLLLATPFAFAPYPAALIVWLVGTAALFLCAARAYVRPVPGFPLVLAILTPAATINIWSGHYGFLTGALWLACFASLDARPVKAGIFAGLLTIKPHLGILIPPLLAIRRKWRTFLLAAALTIIMFAVSGWIFGFRLWHDYLFDVSQLQASLLEHGEGVFLRMMPTSFASFRLAGAPAWAGWVVQAVTAVAAILLCLRAQRRGAQGRELAFIGATATFLILPYAFNYDMTVAALGYALLLHGKWSSLEQLERGVLVAAFLSPQSVLLFGAWGVPLTPPILLAALFVQVRHVSVAPIPGQVAHADSKLLKREQVAI